MLRNKIVCYFGSNLVNENESRKFCVYVNIKGPLIIDTNLINWIFYICTMVAVLKNGAGVDIKLKKIHDKTKIKN